MNIGAEFEGIKNELEHYILNDNKKDDKFKHNTLVITNLHDFIYVICKLTNYFENIDWSYDTDGAAAYLLHTDYRFIYRGMANSSWKIEPSLAINQLWSKESLMVDSLKKMYPDEFSVQMSNFELIAKMQHYGLPTRLCDFTINPLVSLFFACENNEYISVDGRIIMAYKDLSNRYYDHINIISNSISSLNYKCDSLMHLSDYNELYVRKYMNPITFWSDFIMQSGLFLSIPTYISERERRQQAVLMIFPNAILYDPNSIGDFQSFNYTNYRGDLFMKNDFDNVRISGGYHDIPDERLISEFISIIIDSNSKERILSDLSRVGINKSTLFPEIEHATKFIKDNAIRARNSNQLYRPRT